MPVPHESPAVHRAIVVVDVAGFTDPARTVAHQYAVHQGLHEALRMAFGEVGVDLNACTVEDRGDGAMILVPPEVPKTVLADQLPARLIAQLRRYNAVHAVQASVQLRMGLHAGEVRQNAHGVVSAAVNFAFRILDASAAKSALKRSSGVLALIASDLFYQEVICQDPAAAPDSYRRIPVSVKGTSTEAWLRLPDGAGGSGTYSGDESAAAPGDDPSWPVRDVLPAAELDRLRRWLDGMPVPQLPTLVRRAGGGVAPAGRRADAWDVLTYLAAANAGADGVPPVLLFVELLASQVDRGMSANLTAWVDDQARRLRLEPALRSRRADLMAVSADARLHLMIVVQHDAIDADMFVLSSWRQDDPNEWPPDRGETQLGTVDELEHRVDDIVVAAERAWSGHGGTAALEFVLPRALLHLPVHRWHKEHASGDPRPLCLDYPIVVRSLERMRSAHWHRVWHDRWRTLMADPSVDRVHFSRLTDAMERNRIDALLSDPQWVSMVLAEAPTPEPRPGQGVDELTAALRSGLPALMWHPAASADALREVVHWLAEWPGLSDLPARTQAYRRAIFLEQSATFDVNLARDLVVLWDDPRRMVVLDQRPGRPRSQGNAADERERAS
jgi:hypothetical protein